MEIITLVENSSADVRLKAEFGLSLLVKSNNVTIIFDMGASALFADNARIMGIDLVGVDCAVISHGHYDHGGGLATFLQLNSDAPVYLGTEADGQYFGNIGARMPLVLQPLLYPLVAQTEMFCRYIGLDQTVLARAAARLVPVKGHRQIRENIFLLTDISSEYPLAEGNKYLLAKRDGELRGDRFVHELIMVIREEDGLVLFTGCGHRGILNMVKTVQLHFPGEAIKGVVGGFHLSLQPGRARFAGRSEDIVLIAEELQRAGVAKVITGHCTGEDACTLLKEKMGEKLLFFTTGLSYSL